jgi:hypothetical protein
MAALGHDRQVSALRQQFRFALESRRNGYGDCDQGGANHFRVDRAVAAA